MNRKKWLPLMCKMFAATVIYYIHHAGGNWVFAVMAWLACTIAYIAGLYDAYQHALSCIKNHKGVNQ